MSNIKKTGKKAEIKKIEKRNAEINNTERKNVEHKKDRKVRRCRK